MLSTLDSLIDAHAIQRYVARREEEVQHCSQALKKKEFTVLRDTAHKILGNCTTFGFEELQEIAATLQISANNEDPDSCVDALNKLNEWVQANSRTTDQ